MTITIDDLLIPEAVRVPLQSIDKQAAIFELVDLLGETGQIVNPEKLKEVVWERERQRSTSMGHGVAFPHGKSNCTARTVVALGLPSTPLEFESVDRRPVRLIALIASPVDRTSEHIQALGRLSRLMSQEDVRDAAFDAPDAESLYRLFIERDSAE